MEAFTTKSLPRYLLIVLALAGDSTITSDLPPGLPAPASGPTSASVRGGTRRAFLSAAGAFFFLAVAFLASVLGFFSLGAAFFFAVAVFFFFAGFSASS